MVLTAAQTTAFFEDAAQMAIPHATVVQLQTEGITTVDDLEDFDEDDIDQVSSNLRRPPGGAGAFTFGAKSQKRLLIACHLVRYYNTVGRTLTAANMQWTHIMKNFSEQWKSLQERKAEDDPETPKISSDLPIIRWVEAFEDHLHRCVGVRCVPLSYDIRLVVVPPVPISGLAPNQAYSLEHGSLEEDLIARASHNHGLYKDDNKEVYFKLEEATRSTTYADTIKPHQLSKDGRAAFEALKAQYAGVDKWEAMLKTNDKLLHTRKWRGQNNYTLEKFCQHHRNAFVSMQSCAQHINFQLPNEHTRVDYLLDAIETTDAKLLSGLANVHDDKGDGTIANPGKRNDFELAVAYLLPYDPVARKNKGINKRGAAQISDATVSGFGAKIGIGKTGVHLRWYEASEFKKLNKAQKKELFEWRKQQNDSDNSPDKKKSKKESKWEKREKKVSSLISKELDKKLKEMTKKQDKDKTLDQENKAYIMSLFPEEESTPDAKPQVAKASSVASESTNNVRKVSLKSILKRAKNN